MNNVDFLKSADNVYRTKNFIVKQEIDFVCDEFRDNVLLSRDTFYLRTPARDAQYEREFKYKANPDGKRILVSMCSRKYVY